ncbi:MAG: hypothetical protein ACKVPX_00730 [Myxococcaceae bacterium]
MQRVQRHLEAIYGLDEGFQAADFVVDDETAMSLGATGRAAEELLMAHAPDGSIEVALFFSQTLREALESCVDAPERLTAEALGAFCQLTEGVSHFLYLGHVTDAGRSLSLLEMETQAEVDKFATCVLMRWQSGRGAEELHHRLFESVDYVSGLSANERWRYREANRVSGAYCRGLLRHVRARRLDRFLSDLRYAYRLGAHAKLRHLTRRREMLFAG